ncbi:rod shape-determining protein MreD [Fibrobacter sp. UWB15]|jgi:rod shape-determining protein MreD|uniref:rod shape-determining protein MreD n=1 Tax=unclassified Fibrobacter TaxID=2634177 RepID=UPI00091D3BD8|nr:MULTISPECIES: rod shape-determining protein MreD [unclassified Fibrobacter]PWJ66450.1 rod shape-determining protein MreD [Fibrobacter sp. UWB6]SHG03368.1 rod shape-determining protein MreD [Fibrobacter sp. UWB8]SMG21712.1 rod shape-determining protein MreD [Fibrobacter sp. UWB15]
MNNFGWLKTFVLFVIVFALQMTVADWLSFFDVAPDFVMIFIVAVAIRRGPAAGCLWGFVAGFTQDVYAPIEWLGANTIAMTVVGYAVGQLEERFLSLNLPAKVGVLGLGFFVCDMIYYGVTGLSKDVVTNLFLTKSLPECIYTMLIGGIFFYLDLGSKKKKHA